MTKIMRQPSRGGIGKQFVYLPNLVVYLNCSDMKELGDIALNKKMEVK